MSFRVRALICIFCFICLLTLAVVAALSNNLAILTTPLLEVRELWKRAVTTVTRHSAESATWIRLDWFLLTTCVFAALAGWAARHLYRLLFLPMERVRLLGDLGYVSDGKFSMKETANSVRKRRTVGDVPPIYPNGWFGLIESHRLEKKQSTTASALGLNLAIFRDELGDAHVLNAYCPHLGANLGAGGRVFGNCLECPFHGWRFQGDDGKCTYIPYTDKVPEMAKVKSWPVIEINGWIYFWHHAEGIEPNWLPPEIEEITKGAWVYKGRSEHYVNAHIEEVPENGADVVHLGQVHGPGIVAGIDLRYMYSQVWEFVKHNWTAQWEMNTPPNNHIGSLKLTHCMRLFGMQIPAFNLNVTARQIGPAIVYLEFESILGKGAYIQSLTPVEPLLQKMVHNIYVQKRMPTFFAKFLLLGEAIQVERDIMIWNNKQYVAKPLLVKSKEDSLISKHRRWYSQFYSEHSPRLKFQKDTLDW